MPWGVERLEDRHPALAALDGHRLGDVTPFLLPARGELVYFLCRWPTDTPIPVSLPEDAEPDQREAIERALAAWEGAGLGVRFAPGAPPGVGIEMRFVPSVSDVTPTARAGADCAVDPADLRRPPARRLSARVVYAPVYLTRTRPDPLGREVRHSPEELTGTLLHELGHALGFAGHARRGDTVMVRTLEDVRRAGRHLLEGRPFRDAALEALYAVPSGSVLGRAAVGAAATRDVDLLAEAAARRGLAGPLLRVGESEEHIEWHGPADTRYRIRVLDVPRVRRDPAALHLLLGRSAERVLRGPPG